MSRRCALITCQQWAIAKCLCQRHYDQWRSSGRLPIVAQTAAEARIEDALWLLDCGTHTAEVAQRVGYPSVPAMEVALRRAGHPHPEVARESKYARTAAA